MATWTDGAAYAPTTRPDGFASPEVEPLEQPGPSPLPTSGPVAAPQGFTPSAPQAPLDAVGDHRRTGRDPGLPFSTAGALLTAGPIAPQGRDPRTPFAGYGTAVDLPPPSGPPLSPSGNSTLPPPSGPPLPTPTQAPGQVPAAPQAPVPMPVQEGQAWPLPGQTWQQPNQPWPAPGQTVPDQPRQDQRPVRSLMLAAGGCLFLGLFVPAATIWLIVIAGLLLLRTKRVTGPLSTSMLATGVSLISLEFVIGELPALANLACLALLIWTAVALQSMANRRS